MEKTLILRLICVCVFFFFLSDENNTILFKEKKKKKEKKREGQSGEPMGEKERKKKRV